MGNDRQKSKDNGEDEGLARRHLWPPTHPTEGWMGHPDPWLGEKMQNCGPAHMSAQLFCAFFSLLSSNCFTARVTWSRA